MEEANIALRKANEEKAKLKEKLANMQTQLNDANAQGKTTGRKKAKSQSLADYLTCENKDEVIAIIRQHIEQNNSGIPIALTYVALQELDIISGITNNLEYYNALALQYADLKGLRSESSCKHSIGDVQKTQKIYKDGRQCDGRLHEDDKYAPLYNTLLQKLRTVVITEDIMLDSTEM